MRDGKICKYDENVSKYKLKLAFCRKLDYDHYIRTGVVG